VLVLRTLGLLMVIFDHHEECYAVLVHRTLCFLMVIEEQQEECSAVLTISVDYGDDHGDL